MRKLLIGVSAAAVLAITVVVYLNHAPWFAFREKRAYINDKLKDPGSTNFRNERVSSSDWLCGELNSKNGMGAYTGFKKFFVRSPDEAFLEGEGSLNKLSHAEVLQLMDEQIKVNQSYIDLRNANPEIAVPSESSRDEQARRQFFDRKLAEACG